MRSIEVSRLPERAVIEAGMAFYRYAEEKLGFEDAVLKGENRVNQLFSVRENHKRIRYTNAWKKGEQLLERYAA